MLDCIHTFNFVLVFLIIILEDNILRNLESDAQLLDAFGITSLLQESKTLG